MPNLLLSKAQAPFVLVLDMGTSSLRAIVYDAGAHEVEGLIARRPYKARVTEDGGSELDAAFIFEAFVSVLDEIMAALAGRIEIAGVGASSLASNILAVNAGSEALTPAYLYSDT